MEGVLSIIYMIIVIDVEIRVESYNIFTIWMINCLDLLIELIEMTKTSENSRPLPPTNPHPKEKFYFLLESKTGVKSPLRVNFGPKKFVHKYLHLD